MRAVILRGIAWGGGFLFGPSGVLCMAGSILTLPGKVNASNALVVTGTTTSGTTGGKQAIGQCQGVVDSSNRLVVKFT